MIPMAHPYQFFGRQTGKEVLVISDSKMFAAILPGGGRRDFAPQNVVDELQTIADTQDRDA